MYINKSFSDLFENIVHNILILTFKLILAWFSTLIKATQILVAPQRERDFDMILHFNEVQN